MLFHSLVSYMHEKAIALSPLLQSARWLDLKSLSKPPSQKLDNVTSTKVKVISRPLPIEPMAELSMIWALEYEKAIIDSLKECIGEKLFDPSLHLAFRKAQTAIYVSPRTNRYDTQSVMGYAVKPMLTEGVVLLGDFSKCVIAADFTQYTPETIYIGCGLMHKEAFRVQITDLWEDFL